ncbi:MAG: hypothetical protein K0Q72_2267 [Armatimonadetes bacterium]|nr:hypothetical protein [Armatimonadota bacterium]
MSASTGRDPEPTVTVVIATHNRHACLQRVLPSYLAQPQVREVLLIDDGSEPPVDAARLGVPEADLGRVRVERLSGRGGAPVARNRGLDLVRTRWVLFTDDDVFLAPDYVERLLDSVARTGARAIAGRIVYLLDGETTAEAVSRCDEQTGELFDPRYCIANFTLRLPDDREVAFLHAVSLVDAEAAKAARWNEGNAPPSYREETDFVMRSAGPDGKVVLCHDACCFHLSPSDTRTGGQRAHHWLQYELGVIRGNHGFYSEHYALLRRHGVLAGTRWGAELRFIWWRLHGGFMRNLYRSYTQSPIRPWVRQLRSR